MVVVLGIATNIRINYIVFCFLDISRCYQSTRIMSTIKLSHTAKELFLASPRAYFYKYLLNIKETTLGSPLFFGSLIEVGLDVLLQGGTLEEALKAYKAAFKLKEHNGEMIDLSNNVNVRYSKADFDPDVFTDDELKALEGKPDRFRAYSSLLRKGEMLIETYAKDILPRVKKVIATQVYFSLPNGIGDEIMGFADLICEWEDGRTILVDHKTSATPYAQDSVIEGDKAKQLALYYEALKDKYGIDAVGFFVLEKKIRKKIPKTRTQVILGVPPEEVIQKTIDEFDNVLYDIKQGNFPCCSPQCDQYGQRCPYKSYCATDGRDMTGLVKVDHKKTKK